MTLPTSLPTVVGLTMSSLRSTFVRWAPSTAGLEACKKGWVSGGSYSKGDAKNGRGRGNDVGTYSVTSCELLLCAYDCSASLRGVESALASDDCLSCSAAATSLAPNFGDGVPVIHGLECVRYNVEGVECSGRRQRLLFGERYIRLRLC